jgi:hypothetical protein
MSTTKGRQTEGRKITRKLICYKHRELTQRGQGPSRRHPDIDTLHIHRIRKRGSSVVKLVPASSVADPVIF